MVYIYGRLQFLAFDLTANSKALQRIKSQLDYDYMFKYHTLIRVLVHQYSKDAYPTVLTSFFAILVRDASSSFLTDDDSNKSS
jgi:hypothetical protein